MKPRRQTFKPTRRHIGMSITEEQRRVREACERLCGPVVPVNSANPKRKAKQ